MLVVEQQISEMPELGRFELSADGSHTAMILCAVYRSNTGTGSGDSNKWTFQAIGTQTEGRSFADILPLMQTELQPIYLPKTKITVNPTPSVIALTKGESVPLLDRPRPGSGQHSRTFNPLKHIRIGLGWDQMGAQPIDLDSSCVLFDNKQQVVEAVFCTYCTAYCRACFASV